MDMFSLRSLLAAVSYMKQPTTFLLDLFFTVVEPVESDTIDVDIERDGDRMAAFVSPLVEGKVVSKDGFITTTFKPAYIKEKMLITPQDLLKRDPGQTIYAPNSNPEERVQKMLAKNLKTLMKRCIRREEWMAAQALTVGSMNVIGDGVNRNVDFNMRNTHRIPLIDIDVWTDTTNSNPIQDLNDWVEVILDDSGLTADKVVMGKAALRSFLKHPIVKEALDNRRMVIGDVAPERKNNGAVKIADWFDPNVEIWLYEGKYKDPITDETKYLIPENGVLVGASAARCERHYAVIQDLDVGQQAAVQFFPKSWREKDPSGQWVMLQSAPLPIPHQIDGFVFATVQA